MHSLSLLSCLIMTFPFTQFGFISNWFEPSMAPKYVDITFWDFEEEQKRGIRALFYTLPLEQENQFVDLRLHQKMLPYIDAMCQEVISLESFDDTMRLREVENVLTVLVKDWKQKGQIDPDDFFSSLPEIDIDMIIFMERTLYEPIWKKDKKYLVIGVNLGVFEMDLGQPIFMKRLTLEYPWYGERAAYEKIEMQAMLDVANRMGEKVYAIAQMINDHHQEELKAQREAELAAQRERIQNLLAENKEYQQLLRDAKNILQKYEEPQPILQLLRENAFQLESLLNISIHDLSDEQIEQRRTHASEMKEQINQLENWLTEQERLREQRELETPPTTQPFQEQPPSEIEPLQPSPLDSTLEPQPRVPELDTPPDNIFDRRWLLPGSDTQINRNSPSKRNLPAAQSRKISFSQITVSQQPAQSQNLTTAFSPSSPSSQRVKLPTWLRRLNTSRLGQKSSVSGEESQQKNRQDPQ